MRSLREEDCVCAQMREQAALTCGPVQWALLCHPLEFMRSSSSGKLLASVLGGEFLVFGVQEHEDILDKVLSDSGTRLLLPGDGSRRLKDWLSEDQVIPSESVGTGSWSLMDLGIRCELWSESLQIEEAPWAKGTLCLVSG